MIQEEWESDAWEHEERISVLAPVSAAVVAVSGRGVIAANEGLASMTEDEQKTMTPAQALAALKAGHERFLRGTPEARNLMSQVREASSGQYPFASILGCIDSRVSPEFIFDQGIGDIFVARIAGNFTDKDLTGSLEFATKVVGSKLILVLGHTQCGAIQGAIEGVRMGNLTSTLSHLIPAVELARSMQDSVKSDDSEFAQRVTELNVDLTVEKLTATSEILRDLVAEGVLHVKGAIYSVDTGQVTFRN